MSGHRAAEDHSTAYIAAVINGRQRRPFFMAQNDTHGLAYCETRPYPEIKETTEYVIQGGKTQHGKSGNDQNPPQGLRS